MNLKPDEPEIRIGKDEMERLQMPTKCLKDDLAAFMAKWEAGLRGLFQSMAKWAEEVQTRFPKKISSQKQKKAIMGMVKKMHPYAQRSETETTAPFLSMLLEVKAPKGAESFMIPVKLKNLYQGMVVLIVNSIGFIQNPQTLRGKHATLRLTDPESQKSMHIDGTLNLTASHKEIYLTLRIENVPKNKPAIKILENSLPFASKDTQRFWSLRDKSQEGALSLGKIIRWARGR